MSLLPKMLLLLSEVFFHILGTEDLFVSCAVFAVVWKGHHNQYPAREVAIEEIATEKLNKKLQGTSPPTTQTKTEDIPNLDTAETENQLRQKQSLAAAQYIIPYKYNFGHHGSAQQVGASVHERPPRSSDFHATSM
uniref:Uncharacterized protein n=2 Tax=Physcomitrium patens TaxID=3218 RepID=A0A2K1KI04_PHYPA|nr:hypothetical protein PHYPA_007080 [Physcomitrium patens]